MERLHKYSRIKTLSNLRKEISKLDNDIYNRELLMSINYAEFRESISITRLFTTIIAKISVILPMIRTARKLYNYIVDKFWTEEDQDQPENEFESKETDNL